MLTCGQGEPPGTVPGNCRLSSVHGQSVLPGRGGGSSLRVGQCKEASFSPRERKRPIGQSTLYQEFEYVPSYRYVSHNVGMRIIDKPFVALSERQQVS